MAVPVRAASMVGRLPDQHSARREHFLGLRNLRVSQFPEPERVVELRELANSGRCQSRRTQMCLGQNAGRIRAAKKAGQKSPPTAKFFAPEFIGGFRT